MGRRSDPVEEFTGPVRLQRVPMVDGDYDKGGAYWGGGTTPLYCAWDDEGHALYIRAKSLETAKSMLPAWQYVEGSGRGGKNDFSGYLEEMWQQYTDLDSDEPLDKNYQVEDITKKTQAGMKKDCKDFYLANREILDRSWPADAAGHEFWLTRNRHGAGFWDSKHGTDEEQKILTDNAHAYGEVYLYVSRGKVHSD
jgi:hypothetical protein